ncbi:zf-TFIIB domain-containing protein [Spirulina sp. CS-785/01]|uniref:TFIIB-type zinc ribbon-containing protein n=1 Tax=Spirulina sp. CS-785/01 TaxID=3021716 RepID=UPI00232A9128|nr:zf-TFIIB domain-containing protein [Spirulina sp. CS-785/01]MDB9313192.1 zf-TFIIB domain-containing protein [Spirulina sp. CS-785/01]
MYKRLTKCPKCDGEIEQVDYANIEIDRCQDCHGLWFDGQEAEKLKEIDGSEILDDGNPDLGYYYSRNRTHIACPRCGTKMKRMLDIDRYSIWYEKCPNCQGMWLDAGEFKRFKSNFTQTGVTQKIKQWLHLG